MTAIFEYLEQNATAGSKVTERVVRPQTLQGLFGFGILSIALAQAFQWFFTFDLSTFDQVALGVTGGILGAILGARSSKNTSY